MSSIVLFTKKSLAMSRMAEQYYCVISLLKVTTIQRSSLKTVGVLGNSLVEKILFSYSLMRWVSLIS